MAVQTKGKFPDIVKEFKRLQTTLPRVIANTAKNHFLEGFRTGGGKTDKSRGGWTARKQGARRNQGRAILVDSGVLRRDIDVRRTDFNNIVIGTATADYAVYINEGTDNMEAREFLGDSTELNKEVKKMIEGRMKKILEGKK